MTDLDTKLKEIMNAFGNEVHRNASWANLGGESVDGAKYLAQIKQCFIDAGWEEPTILVETWKKGLEAIQLLKNEAQQLNKPVAKRGKGDKK